MTDVAADQPRERWLQITYHDLPPVTLPPTGARTREPARWTTLFLGRDLEPTPTTWHDLRGGLDGVVVHIRPDTAEPGDDGTGDHSDGHLVDVEVFALHHDSVTLVGTWPRIDQTWPTVIAPTIAVAFTHGDPTRAARP